MKALLVSLLFLLSACGSGDYTEPPPNHGYGGEYDVLGPQGMRVRFYKGADTPVNALADVLVLEALFNDVETCTGLNAFPPFVIFVKPASLYIYGWEAVYYDSPPLVLLDGPQIANARDEFIHHLLQMNAGDKDVNHVSRFFTPLAAGGCA